MIMEPCAHMSEASRNAIFKLQNDVSSAGSLRVDSSFASESFALDLAHLAHVLSNSSFAPLTHHAMLEWGVSLSNEAKSSTE